MKLAAFEALYRTTAGAPLSIVGIPKTKEEKISASIEIPHLLSYLAYGDFHAVVKGLDSVPQSDWPPIATTFLTFRGMVILGTYMILLTLAGLYLLARGRLFDSPRFLSFALYSIPVPIVANELGWVSAEMGRQPWIVQGLMRTNQAFSPVVPAGNVLFSIILLVAVYAVLFSVWIYLVRREMAKDMDIVPVSVSAELPPPARAA